MNFYLIKLRALRDPIWVWKIEGNRRKLKKLKIVVIYSHAIDFRNSKLKSGKIYYIFAHLYNNNCNLCDLMEFLILDSVSHSKCIFFLMFLSKLHDQLEHRLWHLKNSKNGRVLSSTASSLMSTPTDTTDFAQIHVDLQQVVLA